MSDQEDYHRNRILKKLLSPPVEEQILESFYGLSTPTKDLPMDKVWCEEVIISTVKRRGEGLDKSDPVRIITQVFLKNGTLIAEFDPHLNNKKP